MPNPLFIRSPFAISQADLGQIMTYEDDTFSRKNSHVLIEAYKDDLPTGFQPSEQSILCVTGKGRLIGQGELKSAIDQGTPYTGKVQIISTDRIELAYGDKHIYDSLRLSEAELLQALTKLAKEGHFKRFRTYAIVVGKSSSEHSSHKSNYEMIWSYQLENTIIKVGNKILPEEVKDDEVYKGQAWSRGGRSCGGISGRSTVSYDLKFFKLDFWTGKPIFLS